MFDKKQKKQNIKHRSKIDLDCQGIHIVMTNRVIDKCVEQKKHHKLLLEMIRILSTMENEFRYSEGYYKSQQKHLYEKFCLLDQDIGITYQRNESLSSEMKVHPFETALAYLKEKFVPFPGLISTPESTAINKNYEKILLKFDGSGIFEAVDMKWKGHFGGEFQADKEMQFDEVKIYQDGTVIANGSDEYGKWTINGKLDQTKISFVKQYIGQHLVNYTGNLSKYGSIHGTWKIAYNQTGMFTFDIGFDQWNGYFKNDEKKEKYRFLINITPEGISGIGNDTLGIFIMKGNWDINTNLCNFIKHYTGKQNQSFFYGKVEKLDPMIIKGIFMEKDKEFGRSFVMKKL